MRTYFRKQIAIPQDHGSWVFILSPLLIGLLAGKTFNYASFNLSVAALAAFLIRQPITIMIKSMSGRRPKEDLSIARAWIVLVFVLLSAVVFVVPIYGMRRRLEDLKKRALQECDRRFQSAAKLLHARLDAGSLKDLEGLNHAMATLTLEREALQRISTWPWAADTLRRYLSSVALPVFVFLLGRYIGRFLGL